MSEQLDLGNPTRSNPDVPETFRNESGKTLTARQQAAYDYVRGRDGVTADQVGAHLHERRGKHPAGEPCDWCRSEGQNVLTSKALRPLVTYRRAPGRQLYIARDKAARAPVERDMGEIPF